MLAAPVVFDRDSFPLSTYPMYARTRGTEVSFVTAQGIRGDAIAGLVIMMVNIIGGVVIGATNGQTIGEALQLYSLLTIGDGLVSQIPALIIATSAGILVTKSSSESNLGEEIGAQVMLGHRALFTGALILLVVSLVPGLPPTLTLARQFCGNS